MLQGQLHLQVDQIVVNSALVIQRRGARRRIVSREDLFHGLPRNCCIHGLGFANQLIDCNPRLGALDGPRQRRREVRQGYFRGAPRQDRARGKPSQLRPMQLELGDVAPTLS